MKRFSAAAYYLMVVLIPVISLATILGFRADTAYGTPDPDWWTICHFVDAEVWEWDPINVDRNSLIGQELWDNHYLDHTSDDFYQGKNVSCEEGEVTPSPTLDPEVTPTPTDKPEVTPTSVPEPTDQPESDDKSNDMNKTGPTCEETTFGVGIQLKDDGVEIKDKTVTFRYNEVTKTGKTDDTGRTGADFDYTGAGEVTAEAEGFPTSRANVDDLVCDGTEIEGQVLGYADTGASGGAMALTVEAMGLLSIMAGGFGYLKLK